MISFAALLAFASRHECDRGVWTRKPAHLTIARERLGDAARPFDGEILPEDPKYYLGSTLLRSLPMTELQAMRINARIEKEGIEATMDVLTASQRELLAFLRAHDAEEWPDAVGVDLRTAWDRTMQLRADVEARDRSDRR